jgi:uncharacterized 2Fe-2S/4Fe-4S cluster protein (DUF4445 family)
VQEGKTPTTPPRLDPALTLDGDAVLQDGTEVARTSGPLHGLAVDLGTTTVVVRLYDLEQGHLLATTSFENPQRFAGSDVLARIRFDGEHPGRLQQRTLLGYLGHAVEEFPGNSADIYEMVVAGNTTMRDLFFGLDVQSIGQYPYRSALEEQLGRRECETTSLSVPARNLRLPLHPAARVYGLPLIGSHIGGDTAACVLATKLADQSEQVVLMDLGTNTEIVAGNRERLVAASAPAGPAFEGGAIECGMPALPGAIEHLIIRGDGSLQSEVIGDVEALGVCGSGLVDALSELLRTGRMNEQGRWPDEGTDFHLGGSRWNTLTEAHISLLAQAKGAQVAGLRIVLDSLGIELDQVARVYLAGGFAARLRLDSARRIGLIPDLPDDRFVLLGNAAIEGAAQVLRSRSLRRQLEQAVQQIEHLELETHPGFFDYFVEGCQFTPVRAGG